MGQTQKNRFVEGGNHRVRCARCLCGDVPPGLRRGSVGVKVMLRCWQWVITVFWLILLSLVFCAYGHALCLGGNKPVDLVTPYHFSAPVVRVAMGLPLGTVIATAVIPEGSVIARCGGDVQEGIWGVRGALQRFVTVRTNLPGVGVRVVSEKQAQAGIPEVVPAWRWNSRARQHPITQGGVRIELIKTGSIQPGVLTSVSGEVQYRMYDRTASTRRLVMRERLRYVGQLRIEVSEAGPLQGYQRLS